jgi:hypothetical protein
MQKSDELVGCKIIFKHRKLVYTRQFCHKDRHDSYLPRIT